MEGRLTHFDQKGNAVMVDVGSKMCIRDRWQLLQEGTKPA